MEETGATRQQVERVALWVPGQYIRFGIIKGWSCFRCLTCLGLARKVLWCIICVATKPPELTVQQAANREVKRGGRATRKGVAYVSPKPLRAGDMSVGAEPSMIEQTEFPSQVDSRIWGTALSK